MSRLARSPRGATPRASPGSSRRGASGLTKGAHRPFLKDLDVLPLPAWDLIDMERTSAIGSAAPGRRRAAVLTSRGCPFDCSWCSKPTFGRNFRQQSPERVVRGAARAPATVPRGLRPVLRRRLRHLARLDRALLDAMAEADLRLKFECLARVDLLKPDLLHRLRAAGLARVYVGVESGSRRCSTS